MECLQTSNLEGLERNEEQRTLYLSCREKVLRQLPRTLGILCSREPRLLRVIRSQDPVLSACTDRIMGSHPGVWAVIT